MSKKRFNTVFAEKKISTSRCRYYPNQAQDNKVPSQSRSNAPISKPIEVGKKYGRNDKVKISKGSEIKELKYKKAESLIQQGWTIVE